MRKSVRPPSIRIQKVGHADSGDHVTQAGHVVASRPRETHPAPLGSASRVLVLGYEGRLADLRDHVVLLGAGVDERLDLWIVMPGSGNEVGR